MGLKRSEERAEHYRDIASRCQSVAGTLGYDGPEDKAKRSLKAASYALDSNAVWARKEDGRWVVRDARGHTRYITLRERLARWLLKGALEIRP